MKVTFCGHAKIIYDMEQAMEIYNSVEMLIKNGSNTFLFGGYGVFDLLSASIVKKLKGVYPDIKSILILAYPDQKYDTKLYDSSFYPFKKPVHFKSAIIKRNQWMIDNADLLVAYVEEGRKGGAMTTLKYAEKKGIEIINLASLEE